MARQTAKARPDRGYYEFWLPAPQRAATELSKLDQYSRLARVPGAWVEGDIVYAPRNAGQVVAKLIQNAGLTPAWRYEPGFTETKLVSVEQLQELLEKNGWLKPRTIELMQDRPYQPAAVVRALAGGGGLIDAAPGAGKTIIGLAFIGAVMPPGGGSAIFVTKTAARLQIASEVSNRTNALAIILEGERGDGAEVHQRIQELTKNAPVELGVGGPKIIYVIGWDVLPAWKGFLGALRARVAIFDEIHRAQSHKRNKRVDLAEGAMTFRKLTTFSAAAERVSRSVRFRLGMTGTPMPDRPRNLWSPLDILEPKDFGPYWGFADVYCKPDKPNPFRTKDDSGASHLDELASRVASLHIQIPREVTHKDLPPATLVIDRIPPDAQNKPLGGWNRDFARARREGKEALFQTRLERAASTKHDYVVGHLDEAVAAKLKVVILSGRRSDTEKLFERATKCMEKAKLVEGDDRTRVWLGHGGISETARHQAAVEYMAIDGPAILVATGYSMGESLDLHDTDHAIITMLPFRVAELIQWPGRFTRVGQKRPVLIRFVVAERNAADESVAAILLGKLPNVVKVLGDGQANEMSIALEGVKGNERALLNSLFEKMARMESDYGVTEFPEPGSTIKELAE